MSIGAGIDDAIDAVESWVAGESFWVQAFVLLAVLLPLAWLAAGLVDRVVELMLRPLARRETLRTGVHPAGQALAPAVDKDWTTAAGGQALAPAVVEDWTTAAAGQALAPAVVEDWTTAAGGQALAPAVVEDWTTAAGRAPTVQILTVPPTGTSAGQTLPAPTSASLISKSEPVE